MHIETVASFELAWNPVTTNPPSNQWLWVKTASGTVCLGHLKGGFWSCDGFRVLDAYDFPEFWAEIVYPRGGGSQ